MFVRGMAFGIALIPLQAATFSTIPPQDSGRASALFNTNRQVASSFGVAILATVLADRGPNLSADAVRQLIATNPAALPQYQQAALDAFHDAYFVGAIMALIGFGFAFLIHDEDAAASMAVVEKPAAAEVAAD
jgi:hypothetical protein